MDPGMVKEDTDFSIPLSDGRQFGLRWYGASNGQPVLALHGTPGSRLKFRLASKAANELGLKLYCPDRWGYGLTAKPLLQPSLAEFANDICEVTNRLGLARFSIVGISGGGPFAATVAAALGARVDKLALIGPVGPILPRPFHGPIGPFHRFAFTAWPRMPGGMRLTFATFRMLLSASQDLAITTVAARAGYADRQILRERENKKALAEIMRAGLLRSVEGPVIDMMLFGRNWNVDLSTVTAETHLWLGLEDHNIPLGPARRLASAIPNAKLTEIVGAGHFWIMENYREVFDWLATDLDEDVTRFRLRHDH
ncbi:Pimeloyl-ACP methyl ester carboxylesterase [Filomicrobium insigne]|uniref:Pimeloyl-ACP methyl ester carboxylesterase n=2 Tax=Filomicrobium insigne TaxID=418854 RepID=A0A1H0Q979_9HYPH|nr:Pimeloyl-ACP methyl ester carboxylesterase [Filomicrobium insigne]